MRLQFKGRYTLVGFVKALETVFGELARNEVDGIAYINMYFQPQQQARKVVLRNDDGDEIDHLVMDEPVRTQRKAFVAEAEGLSQMAQTSLLGDAKEDR